jgi:hypothetical protein
VDRLSGALNEIGQQPEMKALLSPVAQRPMTDTPQRFRDTLQHDFALYSRLAKELDLKKE